MSKCRLCEHGKAEYIAKMKNISNIGRFNMNTPIKVCEFCYEEYNPQRLKRTEFSGKGLNKLFMKSLNDPNSKIHQNAKKMSVSEPEKLDRMMSIMDHTIVDGLIIHWKRIRK